MPIQDCSVGGKRGKRYGKSGKCYTGPNAYRKAAAQAAAIKASGYQENRLNSLVRRDPTRTTMLRKRFVLAMKGRFKKLEKEIIELVEKIDVFGLGSSDYYPVLHHYPGEKDHDQRKHGNWADNLLAKELDKSKIPRWLDFDPDDKVTIGRITYDSVNGLGAIGTNSNINYEGFVLFLKPDDFLRLQPERSDEQGKSFIKEHLEKGGTLGPLYISGVYDPSTNRIQVIGHEGRGRAQVVKSLDPSKPIPVHVVIQRKEKQRLLETRSRDITPDMTMATFVSDKRRSDLSLVKPLVTVLRKKVYGRKSSVENLAIVLHHLPGQHDQKKHGNWARVGAKTARRLKELKRERKELERKLKEQADKRPGTLDTSAEGTYLRDRRAIDVREDGKGWKYAYLTWQLDTDKPIVVWDTKGHTVILEGAGELDKSREGFDPIGRERAAHIRIGMNDVSDAYHLGFQVDLIAFDLAGKKNVGKHIVKDPTLKEPVMFYDGITLTPGVPEGVDWRPPEMTEEDYSFIFHHWKGHPLYDHDQKDHGNWARGIDVGSSKRMDSPSRWKDPNEVIQAIEQASKASPEDIASGKVPLVRKGDPKKFSELTLAEYQADGTVIVTDKFFERSEYSRQLLMAHEFGHEVSMRSFSGGNTSERTLAVLEPFQAAPGYTRVGWRDYRYNNFAGASTLPEEMLADVYTDVIMSEKPPWVEYLPSGKQLPILPESKKYLDVYKHVIAVADRAGLPLPEWAVDPDNFEITENIVHHHWKGHPLYDHDQSEHNPNKGKKPKKEKPDARDVASVEEFRKYLKENAEEWFLDEDDIERLTYRYSRSGIAERLETMEASDYPITLDDSPIDLKMTGPKETERARLLPAYDDNQELWKGKIPIDPEDTLFVKHETTSRWEKEFIELGFDTRSAPPDTRLGRVTVTEGGGLKQSTIEEAGLFIEPNTFGDYRYGVIIQLKAKQVKPTIESLGLGYKTGLEGLYGAKDAMIAGEVIPPENIVGVYAYEGKPVWKPNPKNPNSSRLYVNEDGKLDLREKTENVVQNNWWSFLTKSDQMKYFAAWLGGRLLTHLLGEEVVDSLWMGFINQGFEKGLGNSFDSVRKYKWDTGEIPFYAGARQQFIQDGLTQPASAEKIELLLARFMAGLQGISDETSARMGYKLADGLAKGDSPRKVARELSEQLGITREKALRLTRTETARAHAEGQLVALRQLGVEEVGVAVEWSVSGLGMTKKGYASPCKVCAELKGIVLTLDEAEGLIPRHENCLCSFIPANVGESTRGQKRRRREIRRAIKRSIDKEVGKKRARSGERRESQWTGKELLV